MPTIEVIGWISETGQLQVELPEGLPVGQVLIHIDLPEPVSIQPDPPLPIAKTEQPSRDNSTEWIRVQQRKMSRQNASAPDYRLNWIRHKTQQRKKSYRRSLNREKS
jgi:hypothetical protein